MYLAKIYITLKQGLLDSQGVTVKHALNSMGYAGVEEVRFGKYLELTLNSSDQAEAENQVKEMCERLLSNPVIENYRMELVERP
ncbi:MAG: phosphoribosylformylglycinamidine synthase subunit PurS [bacterium]|nr:phosphoribosylformylglycinamidine synthase subunit PurS [bacterium]